MKTAAFHIKNLNLLLTVIVLLLTDCQPDIQYWDKKPKEMVMSEYLESFPEFSEFNKILETAGLKSCLSARGPYTLFLPSNEQMKEYYTSKGVKSFTDFDKAFVKQLALNHIIAREINTGEIELGAITEPNAAGDYISSEFAGTDIVLNKNCKIVKRNIFTANGVIHLIDKVLDPISKSVFDVLADIDAYSIFTEGLRRTKLADTLRTICFPFGAKTARAWFTILAVADTTFNRFGIFNIEELVARYTNDPANVSAMANGFYRYMEYHCLAEPYFLNQLTTKLYPVLSHDNNVLITVDNDYKINQKDNKDYTRFVVERSNIPAKNGTIHTINDLLPVVLPRPTAIEWEVTDHFDLKQGDYYKKYCQRFYDGENTFKGIKWNGEYVMYAYGKNYTEPQSKDFLWLERWQWIEVRTPKIMKGKYRVSGNTACGSDKSIYEVYIDGKFIAFITELLPYTTFWGELEWNNTESHRIKLVAKSQGIFLWDGITFSPIR